MDNDNKLIAEFMGYKVGERRRGGGYMPENEMRYNDSWDWLMPVLIEIERIIVGEVTWISTYCDIEREYKRAVEWIKKYNDNPKHMTLQ
jgi:transcriptional regulator CtsR